MDKGVVFTQTHTMAYYSAVTFATTWIDLVDVILTEKSDREQNTVWFKLFLESEKQTKQMNITNWLTENKLN